MDSKDAVTVDAAWHVFYDAENCYLVLAASESEAAEQAAREHGTGWQYIERTDTPQSIG